MEDERSSAAVALLPPVPVAPASASAAVLEVRRPHRMGDCDTDNAVRGSSAPSSTATTTSTNAVVSHPSLRLPTPPPLHRHTFSPASAEQHAASHPPVTCESDSNEEPLFHQPPPATLLSSTPNPGRPWAVLNATPPSVSTTAATVGVPPFPASATAAPTTPAGQSLNVGRDMSSLHLPARVNMRGYGSAVGEAHARGGYHDPGTDTVAATAASFGDLRGAGRVQLQRPLFMTGGRSGAAALTSPVMAAQQTRPSSDECGGVCAVPTTPATPAMGRDALFLAEPPTPAKQRRTVHLCAGSSGRGALPGGCASPRLSVTTAAVVTAPHTSAASTTGAAGGAAAQVATAAAAPPKPSLRVSDSLRVRGLHSATANNAPAPTPRATTPAVVPPTLSFKFHRREGSRKRSAEVLSQFSALDLDETPATPSGQTGTGRFTSMSHMMTNGGGGGHGTFPSQPSSSTAVYRTSSGAGAVGAVSPLMIDYATPVGLSQQICGSNTFSQMLLHPSQDVLDASQADTECSNFLARRILNEYNEVRLLGRGSFGTVSLYKEISSGEYVAVKTSPPLQALEMERRYRRERSVMGMVRGLPHVVQLSAAWEEGRVPRMYLQLEYCPGGSVAAAAAEKQRRGEAWTEAEVKVFLAHMCIALDALHRAHIAHVDFKPDNVLIDRDGAYKLSDFGCSVLLDERGRPRPETRNGYGSPARGQRVGGGGGGGGGGTAAYSNVNGSPVFHPGGAGGSAVAVDFAWGDGNEPSTMSVDEGDCRYLCADMLNGKKYFKAGDMFSLGMSLFELMSGQPLPRNGESYVALRHRVPVQVLQRRGYSAELVSLVASLLHSDPPQRPTARQVLQYLRPSPAELRLLASATAMQQWTDGADAFARLQESTLDQPPSSLDETGLPVASADSLRCACALVEASAWLLSTTQQDVHRLALRSAAGRCSDGDGGDGEEEEGEEERRRRLRQPPPPPPPPLPHPAPDLWSLEPPTSPAPRDEACTPMTMHY